MVYTLGEAARATGKSKSTLSKAIKTGKISASKGANGSFSIDPSELHRVYPPLPSERPKAAPTTPQETPEETLRIRELEVLLQAAEDRIRDKEERLSELRDDRDKWRQQASELLEDNRRASALLEDERKRSTTQDAAAPRKGFFGKLFGRGETR